MLEGGEGGELDAGRSGGGPNVLVKQSRRGEGPNVSYSPVGSQESLIMYLTGFEAYSSLSIFTSADTKCSHLRKERLLACSITKKRNPLIRASS